MLTREPGGVLCRLRANRRGLCLPFPHEFALFKTDMPAVRLSALVSHDDVDAFRSWCCRVFLVSNGVDCGRCCGVPYRQELSGTSPTAVNLANCVAASIYRASVSACRRAFHVCSPCRVFFLFNLRAKLACFIGYARPGRLG